LAEICEKNSHIFALAENFINKIDILTAKYGEDLRPATNQMTEAAIKKLVGGKNGIAVCGMTEGVLTSLHPYNAQTQKRELSPAIPPEKGDFLGKIDKFKVKAAEQPNKAASPENARDSEVL
jgi:predicted transcriptional regulator